MEAGAGWPGCLCWSITGQGGRIFVICACTPFAYSAFTFKLLACAHMLLSSPGALCPNMPPAGGQRLVCCWRRQQASTDKGWPCCSRAACSLALAKAGATSYALLACPPGRGVQGIAHFLLRNVLPAGLLAWAGCAG